MGKSDRAKQTEVLLKAQETRRKTTEARVIDTINRLLQENQEITFPRIAEEAGVSKSYLYKWPQIKEYIRDLREYQKGQRPKQQQEKSPGPHSIKTLHEIARGRIQALEAENKEVKRQNQLLRGYVAEIYELKSECERLRKRIRELTHPSEQKVVPIREDIKPKTDKLENSQKSKYNQRKETCEEIDEALQRLRINLGVRLREEVSKHSADKVLLAIKAYEQYRESVVVEKPSACLLAMIKNEAEPNVAQTPDSDKNNEFDVWYVSAIERGLVLDIPKKYLSVVLGEFQVKVIDKKEPSGYIPMVWKEAQLLLE